MTEIDDFAIAKSVADLLKDLDPPGQSRILRWVSESLGIESLGESNVARAREHTPIPPRPPGAGTDIKSFIDSKDPKSDNQFAAAVAYFYRFEAPQNDRLDSITPEQLQEATRLAGRRRLGDPGKTLRNAKDQGYLDSSGRGAFQINSVGENLVAMTLAGQEGARSIKAAKSAKKSKKAKR